MRASKLRLPDSTAAQTRSFFTIASLMLRVEVAGVADAGRAAVAGDVEAELLEVRQQARLVRYSVTMREPGASEVLMCGLTVRPALDRLLREQAGGEQHARVGGVGAGGDGGDQHVAVADLDARSRGVVSAVASSSAGCVEAVVRRRLAEQRRRTSIFTLPSSMRSCGRFGPARLRRDGARSSSTTCV